MSFDMLDVPVAFFVFNRPDVTARVFERIANARPRTLLLIADGPRNADEASACEATRAVVERIDWPCDVRRNFSAANLGCRRRMSTGIDWVFGQVEQAIILEDDCLPEPSFFPYCAELLDRYRDDDRVMMISGDNFQFGRNRDGYSYYFSAINHIWGWASWRRAWRHYDVDMKLWATLREEADFPANVLGHAGAGAEHRKMIEGVYAGRIDTWDVQWSLACWARRGLTILPQVNLISNLGFGPGATHTKKAGKFAEMATEAITFPMKHPTEVERLTRADLDFFESSTARK